jgi:hypothetical protein
LLNTLLLLEVVAVASRMGLVAVVERVDLEQAQDLV